MNVNLKGLLRAVSENNITRAKQYVKVIIDRDITQASMEFYRIIRNMLQAASMLDTGSFIRLCDIQRRFYGYKK